MSLRTIIDGRRMKFLVLRRADMQSVTPEMPYVVISITDEEAPDAEIAESPNRLDVLRLKFHDIHNPKPGKALMSEQDARRIAVFVRTHLDSARLVICQCEAGFSRSAGVAAALSRWLQDEDTVFFRQYLPNRHVYDLVLEAVRESDRHSSVNKENADLIRLLKSMGTE